MSETSTVQIEIAHLFISAGHNYVGHFGKPAGKNPAIARDEITCKTGMGIEGDRYFGHEENFKGQITFFDMAIYAALKKKCNQPDKPPSAMRRNVLLTGIDLNQLIDQRFSIQGIRFEGSEECRPCFWMDQAISPGAEDFLKGSGGLRARILTDGILRKGPSSLSIESTIT